MIIIFKKKYSIPFLKQYTSLFPSYKLKKIYLPSDQISIFFKASRVFNPFTAECTLLVPSTQAITSPKVFTDQFQSTMTFASRSSEWRATWQPESSRGPSKGNECRSRGPRRTRSRVVYRGARFIFQPALLIPGRETMGRNQLGPGTARRSAGAHGEQYLEAGIDRRPWRNVWQPRHFVTQKLSAVSTNGAV